MIYIFVSTEDEIHNIKGGIGTYIAILANSMCKVKYISKIYWISESKTNDFKVISGKLNRIYLGKIDFIHRVNHEVLNLINLNKERIFIESPEWEGLLYKTYREINLNNVLKITRLHTPLSHTSKFNLSASKECDAQHEREKKQIEYSDILSSPTFFIKHVVDKCFNLPHDFPVKSKIIPNPINIYDFKPNVNSREESIELFSTLTGVYINKSNFNIFIIGSVEKRKGVEHMLHAIPTILNKINTAHFYFIGNFHNNIDSLNLNKKLSPFNIRSNFSEPINN